jgi:hypothetical protein
MAVSDVGACANAALPESAALGLLLSPAIATGAGSLCAIVKQCYQCGVSSRDFSLRI